MENPVGHIYFNTTPSSQIKSTPKSVNKQINQGSDLSSSQDIFKPDNQDSPDTDREKMNKLLKENSTVIMKLSSIFPFDLFPKELVIDLNKVSIFDKRMAETGIVNSIQIVDLADVNVNTGIFFAKLYIIDKNFKDEPIEIGFVPKSQALKAKRILLGLNMAYREKIDLTKFSPSEVVAKAEDLGTLHIPEVETKHSII